MSRGPFFTICDSRFWKLIFHVVLNYQLTEVIFQEICVHLNYFFRYGISILQLKI